MVWCTMQQKELNNNATNATDGKYQQVSCSKSKFPLQPVTTTLDSSDLLRASMESTMRHLSYFLASVWLDGELNGLLVADISPYFIFKILLSFIFLFNFADDISLVWLIFTLICHDARSTVQSFSMFLAVDFFFMGLYLTFIIYEF